MAKQRVVKPGRPVNDIERFLYECLANLADIKKHHKKGAKPWYKYDRLHWKISQLGYALGCADCKCISMEDFRKEI